MILLYDDCYYIDNWLIVISVRPSQLVYNPSLKFQNNKNNCNHSQIHDHSHNHNHNRNDASWLVSAVVRGALLPSNRPYHK